MKGSIADPGLLNDVSRDAGGDSVGAAFDQGSGRHEQHECARDAPGACGGEGVGGEEGGVCGGVVGVLGHADPAEGGKDDPEPEVAVYRVDSGI